MWLTAVLLAQAAAPADGRSVPARDAPRLDRPLAGAQGRCDTPDGYDIVVCGRRGDAESRHRLPQVGEAGEAPALPQAEIGLFGSVRGAIEAEQGSLPDGRSAPRAMVRVKVPF
jgi:hypothetical protein